MKCKYCGNKMVMGGYCFHSPTKKHIGAADGENCPYCGSKFVQGGYCSHSPIKKHTLDT